MPSLDKEHSAVILSPPSDLLRHPILQTITARQLQGPRDLFISWIHWAPQLRWLRWDQVLVWIGPQEVTNQPCVWDIGRTHDALHLAVRHVVKLRLPGEKNGKCRMFHPGSGSKQYVIWSNSSSMRDQLFHKSSHHYHHLQVFHSTTDPAFTAGKHALLAATCSKVVISGERPPCIQMIFSWELLQVAF